MGTVLGLLQSAPATDLALKTDILKSLLTCLRESHRTRTMFRKVGAFVYVMSALVSMDGCLAEKEEETSWTSLPVHQILRLLHLVFNTTNNAKFFQQEICGPSSLCDTVRLLGCFDRERNFDSHPPSVNCDEQQRAAGFHQIFTRGVQEFE